MDSDEIYKFVGYAVAVLFFIYLISKALSLNVRIIEGATTIKDSSSKGNSSKGNSSKSNSSKNSKKKDIENNNINDTKNESKSVVESFEKDEKRISNFRLGITNGVSGDVLKDQLTITYKYRVNQIVELNSFVVPDTSEITRPSKDTLDRMNELKILKDHLDVLEFIYDEVEDF